MPHHDREMSRAERLVGHVQELERLVAMKTLAAEALKGGFDAAKSDGFDPQTLRVVLKLRKMTPSQRRERRALEAIYMAALGMLDGDPLPDEARRRLDPDVDTSAAADAPAAPRPVSTPPPAAQAPLELKDPAEARAEGAAAAAAGQRIYDNPYPAGDPCRAAWDEGWCAERKSHGMDLPEAYQRRTAKAEKRDAADEGAEKKDGDA